MDETKIPVSALRKLPPMGTVLGVVHTEDMNRRTHLCVRYGWRDYDGSFRVAFFDANSGEYVGEDFFE